MTHFSRRDVVSLLLAGSMAGGAALGSATDTPTHAAARGANSATGGGIPLLPITFPGSPFGIAWGLYYGANGNAAVPFLPEIRKLGAGFTKIYVFWDQIEPQRGSFDWTATDAFVNQLDHPEEGLISIFSSSSWGTRRRVPKTNGGPGNTGYLPPSPAVDPEDYRRFVHALVQRYRGRVRYWQNDAEPNNPLYWLGTKEEFVAQLKVFAAAVRSADPASVVVVGGYDGVFNPPGEGPPIGNQAVGLAFFDYVIRKGGDAFDVFDLRLYGSPYTIGSRVEYMRAKMAEQGYQKPFICTEYDGPLYFEYPENLEKAPEVLHLLLGQVGAMVHGSAKQRAEETRERVRALYARKNTLPPQTQMFLQGAPPSLDHKLRRLQVCDTVVRNVLALAAGVQKTIYWQLTGDAEDPAARDNVWALVYGKIGLVDIDNKGKVWKRYAHSQAFVRLAENLAGVHSVQCAAADGAPSVYLYRAERMGAEPVYIAWDKRDSFAGEDQPAVQARWPWPFANAKAIDALGSGVDVNLSAGQISLAIASTPIFIHPAPAAPSAV